MYMNSAKSTLHLPVTQSTDWGDPRDINFLLPVRNGWTQKFLLSPARCSWLIKPTGNIIFMKLSRIKLISAVLISWGHP